MIDRLGEIGLFRDCTQRQLRQLAKLMTEIDAPCGTVLCREGFTGKEFFAVRGGRAAVTIADDEIHTIGPGGCFGELSLLDGEPRSATVTAVTDMRLTVLSRREFDEVLVAFPNVSRRLLQAMAAKLRAVYAQAGTGSVRPSLRRGV